MGRVDWELGMFRFGWALLALLCAAPAPAEWYKGNTHAHSAWSDGEAAPEHIAAWFKDRGYHFLCFSEHHILQEGVRHVSIREGTGLTPAMVSDYRAAYGEDWVETISEYGVPRMRLKTHEELGRQFNEPGRFLLIQGQEITTLSGNPHVIALNLREPIKGAKGGDPVSVTQDYLDAVAEQQSRQGIPMLAHLNHPNWSNGITAEDMIAVPTLRYFEIKNAQASVRSEGWPEMHRPSVDRLWDIVLSVRLTQDLAYRLYGFGSDDCHVYHTMGGAVNNPGRAWTMVQAPELTWAALHAAFERGDFYASTGVTLSSVTRNATGLALKIAAEPDTTYTTRFFGTRRGFDPAGIPVLGDDGKEVPGATRVYSEAIGAVLLESTDLDPVYRFQGDELYVRAVVTSSKDEENPIVPGTKARAWTQPAVAP